MLRQLFGRTVVSNRPCFGGFFYQLAGKITHFYNHCIMPIGQVAGQVRYACTQRANKRHQAGRVCFYIWFHHTDLNKQPLLTQYIPVETPGIETEEMQSFTLCSRRSAILM